VIEWIEEACTEGARLITGGTQLESGILAPAVLADVPPAARIWAAEAFGPVVAVLSYAEFDEALELANASDFGMQAGVFTNDLAKAMTAIRRLDFGAVIINDVPTVRVDQQPYGGNRDSGNTREGPRYAVMDMTELRLASLPA